MYEHIKSYINGHIDILYKDADTETKNTIKDSLYTVYTEYYNSLIEQGLSEFEAYNTIVKLLLETNNSTTFMPPTKLQRILRALTTSISIFLFIFSIGMYPLVESHFNEEFAILFIFTTVAIGVAILTFNAVIASRSPKSQISLDTSRPPQNKRLLNELQEIFSALLWIAATILFFSNKFYYNSWLIFLVAAFIQCIIKAIFVALGSYKK